MNAVVIALRANIAALEKLCAVDLTRLASPSGNAAARRAPFQFLDNLPAAIDTDSYALWIVHVSLTNGFVGGEFGAFHQVLENTLSSV